MSTCTRVCSRNREGARVARGGGMELLEQVLGQVAFLKEENKSMRAAQAEHAERIGDLEREVKGLRVCLEAGCTVHCERGNLKGETALHSACREGALGVVKHLFASHDAAEWVDGTDGDGETPAHVALKNKHTEVVRVLAAESAAVREGCLVNEKIERVEGGVIRVGDVVAVHTTDMSLILDVGSVAMKREMHAAHDSWATNHYAECLEGRRGGELVREGQALRILTSDSKVCTDPSKAALRKEMKNTSAPTRTQRLRVVSANKRDGAPLHYGDTFRLHTEDGRGCLDTGDACVTSVAPASSSAATTHLVMKKLAEV